MARSTAEILRQNYGDTIKIYQSEIPLAIKAAETSAAGRSVYAYDKNSKVSKAYAAFTKEVLEDGKVKPIKSHSSFSR